MSREVGMEISIGEMLRGLKKGWVLILAAVIVCGALGGVFGYIRSSSQSETDLSAAESQAAEEQARYEENLKMSQEYSDLSQDVIVKMRREWMRTADMYRNHPLMKLDGDDCAWNRVTLRFEPDSGYHYGTVYDWIQQADYSTLFGDSEDYKNDLIQVEDRENETAVLLIRTEGFDTEKAADYLESFLKSEAAKNGVKLLGTSTSFSEGRLSNVTDFQINTANQLNLLMGSISNANSVGTVFPAPVKPADSGAAVSKTALLKYGIIAEVW